MSVKQLKAYVVDELGVTRAEVERRNFTEKEELVQFTAATQLDKTKVPATQISKESLQCPGEFSKASFLAQLSVKEVKKWLAYFQLHPELWMLEKRQLIDYLFDFDRDHSNTVEDLYFELVAGGMNKAAAGAPNARARGGLQLLQLEDLERTLSAQTTAAPTTSASSTGRGTSARLVHVDEQNDPYSSPTITSKRPTDSPRPPSKSKTARHYLKLSREEEQLIAAILVVVQKLKTQAGTWLDTLTAELREKVPRYGLWQNRDRLFYKKKPVFVKDASDPLLVVVIDMETEVELEVAPVKLRRFDADYFPEHKKFADIETFRASLMEIVATCAEEEQLLEKILHQQESANDGEDGRDAVADFDLDNLDLESMSGKLDEITKVLTTTEWRPTARHKLPKYWVEKISTAYGISYFYNTQTGITTWERPTGGSSGSESESGGKTGASPEDRKKKALEKNRAFVEKYNASFGGSPEKNGGGRDEQGGAAEGYAYATAVGPGDTTSSPCFGAKSRHDTGGRAGGTTEGTASSPAKSSTAASPGGRPPAAQAMQDFAASEFLDETPDSEFDVLSEQNDDDDLLGRQTGGPQTSNLVSRPQTAEGSTNRGEKSSTALFATLLLDQTRLFSTGGGGADEGGPLEGAAAADKTAASSPYVQASPIDDGVASALDATGTSSSLHLTNHWAEKSVLHMPLAAASSPAVEKREHYFPAQLQGGTSTNKSDGSGTSPAFLPSFGGGAAATSDKEVVVPGVRAQTASVKKIQLANEKVTVAHTMQDLLSMLKGEDQLDGAPGGGGAAEDQQLKFQIPDLRANGFAPTKSALRKIVRGLGSGKKLAGKPKLLVPPEEYGDILEEGGAGAGGAGGTGEAMKGFRDQGLTGSGAGGDHQTPAPEETLQQLFSEQAAAIESVLVGGGGAAGDKNGPTAGGDADPGSLEQEVQRIVYGWLGKLGEYFEKAADAEQKAASALQPKAAGGGGGPNFTFATLNCHEVLRHSTPPFAEILKLLVDNIRLIEHVTESIESVFAAFRDPLAQHLLGVGGTGAISSTAAAGLPNAPVTKVLRVVFLAISKILTMREKNTVVKRKLQNFHAIHSVKTLKHCYGVTASCEKLLVEINKHLDDEEAEFLVNFENRKSLLMRRFQFLADCYMEEDEQQGALGAAQGEADPALATQKVLERSILYYISVDAEEWLDAFLQASQILQYAVFFDFTKAKAFDPREVAAASANLERAKERRVKEIGKQRDYELLPFATTSTDDTKAILQRQAITAAAEKKILVLENATDFFQTLLTGKKWDEAVDPNISKSLLAKLAIDSFRHYVTQNHIFCFVKQIFDLYTTSTTISSRNYSNSSNSKAYAPSSQILLMKRQQVVTWIESESEIATFPRAARSNELLKLIIGDAAYDNWREARLVTEQYEACEEVGTVFERVATSWNEQRIEEWVSGIGEFQQAVLQKIAYLKEFHTEMAKSLDVVVRNMAAGAGTAAAQQGGGGAGAGGPANANGAILDLEMTMRTKAMDDAQSAAFEVKFFEIDSAGVDAKNIKEFLSGGGGKGKTGGGNKPGGLVTVKSEADLEEERKEKILAKIPTMFRKVMEPLVCSGAGVAGAGGGGAGGAAARSDAPSLGDWLTISQLDEMYGLWTGDTFLDQAPLPYLFDALLQGALQFREAGGQAVEPSSKPSSKPSSSLSKKNVRAFHDFDWPKMLSVCDKVARRLDIEEGVHNNLKEDAREGFELLFRTSASSATGAKGLKTEIEDAAVEQVKHLRLVDEDEEGGGTNVDGKMGGAKMKKSSLTDEDFAAAEKTIEDYWASHAEMRKKLEEFKQKKAASLQQELDTFRASKTVAFLEEKNFERISKVFGYEKKRATNLNMQKALVNSVEGGGATGKGASASSSKMKEQKGDKEKDDGHSKTARPVPSSPTKMKKAKLPFLKEGVATLEMAHVVIAYGNLKHLQNLVTDMHVEGVESSRKKALLEHQIRMFLVQLDKEKLPPNMSSLKGKVEKRTADLQLLEQLFDEKHQNHKPTSTLNEANLVAELDGLVEKRKVYLENQVRVELKKMQAAFLQEGTTGNDNEQSEQSQEQLQLQHAQQILTDFEEQRKFVKKKTILTDAYRKCCWTFLVCREITSKTGIGCPEWFLDQDTSIPHTKELVQNLKKSLKEAQKKMTEIDLVDGGGGGGGASPSKGNKVQGMNNNKRRSVEVSDFQSFSLEGMRASTGGTTTEGDRRAEFLAKHLKNTLKLQTCLEQKVTAQ
eukprot:g15001.t1